VGKHIEVGIEELERGMERKREMKRAKGIEISTGQTFPIAIGR